MDRMKSKKILLEAENDEQEKLIEAFIQQHKLVAFRLEDQKADENDFFNDMARVLIPLIR